MSFIVQSMFSPSNDVLTLIIKKNKKDRYYMIKKYIL